MRPLGQTDVSWGGPGLVWTQVAGRWVSQSFSLRTWDHVVEVAGSSALLCSGDSVLGVFYMVHFRRNNDDLETIGHGV